jgi:predicted small metal-binding protein
MSGQRKGEAMAKIINCECGYVVRGETDDEIVANALAHLERDHPDLVGKRSREDILAAAEEV